MVLSNIGLFIILGLVLSLPFLLKKVEKQLEFFLFFMGCAALTITAQWDSGIISEALIDPIKISLAVLVAGFLFRLLQRHITGHLDTVTKKIGIKALFFLIVVGLGFLSSIITAIIASLILVEIIHCLNLERETKIKLVILSCFAIGLGAALTPIGEPLSTIAIAKLKGHPHYADFFFLARHLGWYVASGVVAFGLLSMVICPLNYESKRCLVEKRESIRDILVRTGKVYLFVMALVFLGRGFKPIIDSFISNIPYKGLYWMNMVSAVLDNATLTAAEIGPSMHITQTKAALLGLLISGGMLIPGNIPNIISAGKLNIKSMEWAKFGVPLGLITMLIYFFLLK